MPRLLTLDDGSVWQFTVGKYYSRITSPDGKAQEVLNATLVGVTPREFEEAREKGAPDGVVAPSHVRRWILAYLALDKSAGNR